MKQGFRNDSGGNIDRNTRLDFSFDGVSYQGHPGDTLASALLANGVRLVGRSFKYHRPRGIFSAGPEEPGALVQLGRKARAEPNTRATQVELTQGLEAFSQNCWPGLRWDLMAVNNLLSAFIPAGFYYKTFMAPRRLWPWYESLIRRAAGMGTAPTEADPDSYLGCYAHCDVLVAGAGASGLMAARSAARTGARVIIADENPTPGGWLRRERLDLDAMPAINWIQALGHELAGMPNVTFLTRTTAFGYYDHNMIALLEQRGPRGGESMEPAPRQRLWRVRARRVVLATGAIERPLVFANNDRPGIMLAGAARAYLNQYAVRPGNRAIVATNNNSAYLAAADLHDGGVNIAAVVDSRDRLDSHLMHLMQERGIPVDLGHTVHDTRGGQRIKAARTGPIKTIGGQHWQDCDLLCVSGGWAPTVHLHAQSGARPVYSSQLEAFVPGASKQAEQSVGAARGLFDLQDCLQDGLRAGLQAARLCGFPTDDDQQLPLIARDLDDPGYSQEAFWAAPKPARRSKQFVDLQDDVTSLDIELAHREGYVSVEHLKRYTTLGMGTDQGKTSNINGMALLAQLGRQTISQVGTTTFRPPYTPVTLGALAGPETGAQVKPRRYTPIQARHEALGAVFAPLGLWLRPQAYPRDGETLHASAAREARAVRSAVGLTDVSTLGKVSVEGPDAAEFLDRIYVNPVSSLPVGKARYGLMLREDGMIFDDGTVTRTAAQVFFLTSTSGNAAAVLQHLEYHLDVVWPELDVNLCDVTEQWAALALAGPLSRQVLAGLTQGSTLDPDHLPHMGCLECEVAGIPARIIRISFSGELAFEIYVAASRGAMLWDALLGVTQPGAVTPYGMDALEILRIEKGYIGMGTEADGRTTPADLGLARMLSKKKRFVGQPGLRRPGLDQADRLQLVGLLPVSAGDWLAEGAQVLGQSAASGPGCSIGHVSSAVMSVALEQSVALALVKGGRERMGETVYLADPARGARKTIPATVTQPCFFDPDGERLRG
jgi:sarcosine oxidase subunit alpha